MSAHEEIDMKAIVVIRKISMIAASLLVIAGTSFGQTATAKNKDGKDQKEIKTPAVILPAPSSDTDKEAVTTDQPVDDEILPYYNNYLQGIPAWPERYHFGRGFWTVSGILHTWQDRSAECPTSRIR